MFNAFELAFNHIGIDFLDKGIFTDISGDIFYIYGDLTAIADGLALLTWLEANAQKDPNGDYRFNDFMVIIRN